VTFTPSLPGPKGRDGWQLAASAALLFWQSASEDQRISKPFARLGQQNLLELNRLVSLA
jgi:hypothetical protein